MSTVLVVEGESLNIRWGKDEAFRCVACVVRFFTLRVI